MKFICRYILLCLLVVVGVVTGKAGSNNTISVGVMLPLHQVDGDGKRMIEYYRGMLTAFEQLKKEGYHINVHAWNVNIDTDIKTTLLDPNATKCDLIFGPLYSKQVKSLGDFCKTKGIRLVIPFSISGNDVAYNSNIFQVYQDETRLINATVNAFIERFSKSHPVNVALGYATI